MYISSVSLPNKLVVMSFTTQSSLPTNFTQSMRATQHNAMLPLF